MCTEKIMSLFYMKKPVFNMREYTVLHDLWVLPLQMLSQLCRSYAQLCDYTRRCCASSNLVIRTSTWRGDVSSISNNLVVRFGDRADNALGVSCIR